MENCHAILTGGYPPCYAPQEMVMANLLAIYGGVAADSTLLNFRSLNVLWDHLLRDAADAVIYWYRSLEKPWRRAIFWGITVVPFGNDCDSLLFNMALSQ